MEKLVLIKRIWADPIATGELIIEDNGRHFEREANGKKYFYHHVAFFIHTPTTFKPSTDKLYKTKLVMSRDIELMSEETLTQHLAINLTDRLRSAWQEIEAR